MECDTPSPGGFFHVLGVLLNSYLPSPLSLPSGNSYVICKVRMRNKSDIVLSFPSFFTLVSIPSPGNRLFLLLHNFERLASILGRQLCSSLYHQHMASILHGAVSLSREARNQIIKFDSLDKYLVTYFPSDTICILVLISNKDDLISHDSLFIFISFST